MLTIFSVPKPFRGHIGIIQQNAIRSWTRLGEDHEVILFGAERGTAEAAKRLSVRHEPELECSEYDTPLVSDLFERAQALASHDWLCYVNCDIVLMSDLPRAVRRISTLPLPFLMSGRRWRLDVDRPLDLEPGWEEDLRRRVGASGRRDSVLCMDYFVFARGLIPRLPKFALGRTRWDSYLPYRARQRGAIFVDATDSVMAVHQNHAFASAAGKQGMRSGPEGARNRGLASSAEKCTLGDASHKLTERGLRRAIDDVRFRYWLLAQRRRPYVGLPVRLMLKRFGSRGKTLLVR